MQVVERRLITADGYVIREDNVHVRGSHNQVSGSGNVVEGDDNTVTGAYNVVFGDRCVVGGCHSCIRGAACSITGHANTVVEGSHQCHLVERPCGGHCAALSRQPGEFSQAAAPVPQVTYVDDYRTHHRSAPPVPRTKVSPRRAAPAPPSRPLQVEPSAPPMRPPPAASQLYAEERRRVAEPVVTHVVPPGYSFCSACGSAKPPKQSVCSACGAQELV